MKSVTLDPMSTKLGNGEVQLWSRVVDTKGFFRKKVTESLVITNFRIMRVDNDDNKIFGYILFPQIDDVIVMNTRRLSQSQSTGYGFSSGGYRTRYGTSTRSSSGTSKTVGDIVFVVNGQKISWGGIPDPTGLKNFIKSIKKTMYDPWIKLATKSKSSPTGIPCPSCGLQNPKASKFCNNCGKNLASVCTKCGTSNPLKSSFCGKCGFSLQ